MSNMEKSKLSFDYMYNKNISDIKEGKVTWSELCDRAIRNLNELNHTEKVVKDAIDMSKSPIQKKKED